MLKYVQTQSLKVLFLCNSCNYRNSCCSQIRWHSVIFNEKLKPAAKFKRKEYRNFKNETKLNASTITRKRRSCQINFEKGTPKVSRSFQCYQRIDIAYTTPIATKNMTRQ